MPKVAVMDRRMLRAKRNTAMPVGNWMEVLVKFPYTSPVKLSILGCWKKHSYGRNRENYTTTAYDWRDDCFVADSLPVAVF